MTPKARAMLDLVAACKKLGWEARMHSAGGVEDGLVAGTAGYIRLVTGAVDVAEAEGSNRAGDTVCVLGSGESEAGQDGATEAVYGGAESAENHGKVPSAPKSKVAGRILGAVDGKPVGMLAEQPSVECEPVILEGREEAPEFPEGD